MLNQILGFRSRLDTVFIGYDLATNRVNADVVNVCWKLHRYWCQRVRTRTNGLRMPLEILLWASKAFYTTTHGLTDFNTIQN